MSLDRTRFCAYAICGALSILFNPCPALAHDVIVYAVGKGHNFEQTASATVVQSLVDPWEADAFAYLTAAGTINSASVGPQGNPVLPMVEEGYRWEFSNAYASQALMDAEIPNGTYTVGIQTKHEGIINADIAIPVNSYPTPPPRYTNYVAAQGLNAAADFTVGWDAFTGGTTEDFIVFSIALEPAGIRTIIFSTPLPNQPGALTGTSRQCIIPAGTLQANHTYYGILHFYKVVNKNSSAYSGVPGYGIFASVTQIPIKTIAATPPKITQAPSNQCLAAGSTATFSVVATGTALSYQWSKDFAPAPIAGATNSIFSITNIQHADAGSYTVRVSDNGATSTASVRLEVATHEGLPGSRDPLFNAGGGVDNNVLAMVRQPDGKILIAGQFLNVNNISRHYVARLNPDGGLDQSFDPGSGPSYFVMSLALQTDGKIIIGGIFQTVSGTSRKMIARLNANGSLDPSFDPGTGFGFVVGSTIVYSLAIQSDGKVIVGGSFTNFNVSPRNNIVRLLPNGSLDTSFDPGAGADDVVQSVALQSDGKVLVGGYFSTFNGISRSGLARLNRDGTLDQNFAVGTGALPVLAFAEQSDGKVLIGGDFTAYNNVPRGRIARLNANGALDLSFNPGSGADFGRVATICFEPQGKLVIGGNFSSYNGTYTLGVARLDSSGVLDTSFKLSTDLNSPPSCLIVPEDGTIVIGGSFLNYSCSPANGIVRLIGMTGAPFPTLAVTASANNVTLSWPVVGPEWSVESSPSISDPFVPLSGLAKSTNAGRVSTTLPTTNLHRFYRQSRNP